MNKVIGSLAAVSIMFLVRRAGRREKSKAKPIPVVQTETETKLDRKPMAHIESMQQDMLDLYPKLTQQYTEHLLGSNFQIPLASVNRIKQLLDFSIQGGKMHRGLLVLNTVRHLCPIEKIDFHQIKTKALVLAWCTEILQACFLVADDIMDASFTRRGKPCWFRLPNVGFDAINDAMILESFVYFLLRRYFWDDPPMYRTFMGLFHEVALQTEIGQMLDLESNPALNPTESTPIRPVTINKFNEPLYKQIVRLKTAYYSFYLPVASGMLLCGVSSEKQLSIAELICVELGEKFQIQDDYLDCYGNVKVSGKIGTDIEDNKCSWLVVQALLRVTEQQRLLLKDNYGHHDPSRVRRVKELYEELNLKDLYLKQEQRSYDAIVQLANQHAADIPKEVFLTILNQFHLRQK